jgi:SAM-dependent methyltransferase
LKHAGLPGRLLDVGCGCGFFLKSAQDAGWEVLGVDLNTKAISYATSHLQVNALPGDLRDAHFPDGSFDLVTLWNVLDHAPDPIDLLREVHRVLKDDGRVFIRTPNAVWHYRNFRLANFLRNLGSSTVFDKHPHATFIFLETNFSRFTLRLVLDRSGIVPLSIRNSPPIPGDPYFGLGPIGKRLAAVAKVGVYGIAQGVAIVSGSRWLIGPSLEAWGKRGQIDRFRA